MLAENIFPGGGYQARYVLCLVDVTVYPANATLIGSALEAMGLLLNMCVHNVGHVQLPLLHSNTTPQIIFKHKRLVEDNLMYTQKLDISQTVALQLLQPEDGHAADKRGGIQCCLFVAADPSVTKWTCPHFIGPLNLVRVKDMIGYSDETRFGATARTEQILGLHCAF